MGDEPVVGQRPPVVQRNAAPAAAAGPAPANGRERTAVDPYRRAANALIRLCPSLNGPGFNQGEVEEALAQEFARHGCLSRRAFERIFFHNRSHISEPAWNAFVGSNDQRDGEYVIANPRDLASYLEQFEEFQEVVGSGMNLETFFNCRRITVVPFDDVCDYMAGLDRVQIRELIERLGAGGVEAFARAMGISTPLSGRTSTEDLYNQFEQAVVQAMAHARTGGPQGAHSRRMLGLLGLALLNRYDSACVEGRIRLDRMGLSDRLAFRAFWFGRDGQDGFLAYLVGPELAARSRGDQTVIAPTGAEAAADAAPNEAGQGESADEPAAPEGRSQRTSDVTRADYRAIREYSGRIENLRGYVREHNLRLTVRLDDLDPSSPDFQEVLGLVESGEALPSAVAYAINHADAYNLRRPELPGVELTATPAGGVSIHVVTDEEIEAAAVEEAPVEVNLPAGSLVDVTDAH